MRRRSLPILVSAALALAAPAFAQSVEVTPLAAPDLFSTAARDTGLGQDLWRGASLATARAVLPLVAAKPLSPAAQALARRVLGTGAPGPDGAGQDRALAGQRVAALLAVGDAPGAAAILSRTAGVERTPDLARAAAEAALLAGDDDRACQIGEALPEGRGDIYWLRLRAYCQQRAGQGGAAQLTFDLAQAQARDAAYGRLMGARLAGGGSPGAASLRNGLDYALSRSLGLDLSAAQASPAVAAALAQAAPDRATWKVEAGAGPAGAAVSALAAGDLATARRLRGGLVQDQIPDATPLDLALLDAMLAVAEARPDGPTLDRLVERGGQGEAKVRARAQGGAMLLAAAGAPLSAQARADLAGFTAGEAKAPPARALALDLAADQKLMGETALVALWICADAGVGGPALGDRARIVRALRAAGLEADARAFAVEGLLALR